MSGCENLATKSDVSAILARLEAIERKIPDENRLAQKVADAVRSTMLAMQNAILQAINDSRLTVVTKLGALETVVLANLRTIESIIRELGVLISTSMNNLRDVILGAIYALRDILLELIRRFFNPLGDRQDSFDYARIERAINGAHVQTRTILAQAIGNAVQFLSELIQGMRTDYNRIDAAIAKHHAATRAFIAQLFNNFRLPPVDFTDVLNKLDQIESLTNAGIGSILNLLNTIWAFLQTFRPDANVDYQRIEKAINDAHLQTRTILAGAISNGVQYLAELIQSIKATVDYGRIKRLVDDAAANTQNNINNNLRSAIDYSRIASIIEQALGSLRGNLTSLIAAYGGAIYQGIQEIKELLKNRVTIGGGSSQANNQIQRIYQVLGCDDYPVTVPSSFITKEGVANPERQIPTLTQYIDWYVRRFDEIVGQWEIPIEIKDTDPTTPGDQPQKIKLPNMAEAIAEMFMLLMQISIDGQTALNIATRMMFDGGQDKQQNFMTYKLVDAVADFLGFDFKYVEREMPLMFTPGKSNYSEILQHTKIKVGVPEYNEKLNLQADLMRFRKAASILDSTHFRKINPNANIKAQIVERILGLTDLVKDTNQKDSNETFKQFLEDVEKGFTNTPGVGDPTKPYGREYEDRPRFRDLTALQNPEED